MIKDLLCSGVHSIGHIIHSSRASPWQKHKEVRGNEPDFALLSGPVIEALGYIDLV